MADWAAAAAAWAKSGEGEKSDLAPPPPPPPAQSFEQQQLASAWGGTEQQQMWMDPALAGHDGQLQHGGFASGPSGVDPMGGAGGHQGYGHGGTVSRGCSGGGQQ